MTVRLDEFVLRGWLDNTVPGHVTGRIWLIGRAEPLQLNLKGDCWRDLAGLVVSFENPHAQNSSQIPAKNFPTLRSDQSGVVGDITASRRVRCHDESKEDTGYVWANLFSVEWFDQVDGRCVIESDLFSVILGDRSWNMTDKQETAQKTSNQERMRSFVKASMEQHPERVETLWEKDEADEFLWELRLRESDRLSEVFQEVMDKYIDEPDSMCKQAYVMGWDQDWGDELAEEDEWETEEWQDDGTEVSTEHPLLLLAQDCASQAFESFGGYEYHGPGGRLCGMLMQVSGMLIGPLASHGTAEQEPGYVLAILKRCLHWLNDALTSCTELAPAIKDAESSAILAKIRGNIFALRDGINDLRREIKKN